MSNEYNYESTRKLLQELKSDPTIIMAVNTEIDTILKSAGPPAAGSGKTPWTPPDRPGEEKTRRSMRMGVALVVGFLGIWIILGGGFSPFALLFGGIFLLIAYFVWR